MLTKAMPFYECREGIYEIDEFECTEIFVITGKERALVLDTGTGIGDPQPCGPHGRCRMVPEGLHASGRPGA